METLRVDQHLSIRTANVLRYNGYDISKPNPELQRIVETEAWQELDNFGPKRRDELNQALAAVQKQLPESIATAIELLEAHGYTVTPPT
ncbi:hypothetical protein [Halomonas sp. DWK9]|uniref:hypothetical protein n=1 Tax=Halomonas sp. DWK9 TaxID=3060155 RepID=UPI00287FB413|nr:hypothetical protein [Halomonas sp. DWK9]